MANDIFGRVRARLLSRFPPPIPESFAIYHRGCGGEVTFKNKWDHDDWDYVPKPHRMQCEKATYQSSASNPRYRNVGGCGGCWFIPELEIATDNDFARWFTVSDLGQYKLELVDPRQDSWVKRAYHRVVRK